MKFKPNSLGNRVLIKPKVEKVSAGGIVLSRDTRVSAIEADRGEVFMIGPQAWYDLPDKPEIAIGDMVFYSKYGAKTIKPDPTSDDYLVICNDMDVLAGYSE